LGSRLQTSRIGNRDRTLWRVRSREEVRLYSDFTDLPVLTAALGLTFPLRTIAVGWIVPAGGRDDSCMMETA
jgi:hypothetical protein